MERSMNIHPAVRTIIRVIVYWIAYIGMYWTMGSLFGLIPGGPYLRGMGNWVSGTVAAFFVTWLFLKWEKNAFRSIGLVWERATPGRFFKGLLLGAVIFLAMFGMLLTIKGVELEWIAWHADGWTLVAYLCIIPLGIMEEVAFRSYSFRRLNEVNTLRVTQVITAFAFALYHVAMGWTVYIAFLGPFAWSFVFGLGAAWSRGIAIPAGIHIAINIMQGAMGLKGAGLICRLKYTPNSIAAAERMGIILQLSVLAVAIIATEYFIRRKRS